MGLVNEKVCIEAAELRVDVGKCAAAPIPTGLRANMRIPSRLIEVRIPPDNSVRVSEWMLARRLVSSPPPGPGEQSDRDHQEHAERDGCFAVLALEVEENA